MQASDFKTINRIKSSMDVKTQIVIQNNEEIVVKFLKDGGQLLFLGKDEQTYRLFKNALITALSNSSIAPTFIKNANTEQILTQIEMTVLKARNVFIILDLKQPQEYGIISDIRKNYDKSRVPVIVLTKEIGASIINLLQEIGTNSVLVVPYSPVNLIEKIANTIKPSGLGEIIEAARKLLSEKQYDSVLRICDTILKRKPDSAAAYMLKGDVYLAMLEEKTNTDGRDEKKQALHFYTLAWRGNQKYIEPLKKLLNFYQTEKDIVRQLHILVELDELSPLSIDRKIDIGSILIRDFGRKEEGIKFLDSAIALLKKEHEGTDKQISGIYQRINDALKDSEPELAGRYRQ